MGRVFRSSWNRAGRRRPRTRAGRFLIWVLALLAILLLLSLLFGGFQKGKKVGSGPAVGPRAQLVRAGGSPTGSGVSRG
jgi:hypothetical protein